MSDVQATVLAKLDEMGLKYNFCEHAPVHTIEDCAVAERLLNAIVPKNIFLTPRNKSARWLLLVRPDAQFKTADVSKQLGVSRLSFATPEMLMESMRTLPGAISPMGLLFDEKHEIRLAIDAALCDLPRLAFHPCVNTASLAMDGPTFFGAFLPALGYTPTFVEIHDFKE